MDDIDWAPPPANPKRLIPRFFLSIKQDPVASEKEGRAICIEREMIEIRVPGNVKDTYTDRVTAEWKNKYPEEYKHWKATQNRLVQGTPLKECPKITNVRAAELNIAGILTCEQLVGLDDSQMQKCGMDTRKLIAEVNAWMQAAKDTALVTKQASEIEGYKAQVADLKRQIQELADRFGSLETTKRRPTLSTVK